MIPVISLVPSKPAYVQPWRAFSCTTLRRHVVVCEVSGPLRSVRRTDARGATDMNDWDQARVDLPVDGTSADSIDRTKIRDGDKILRH